MEAKKICAVSPIIGGQAVKGPAAKMFNELGIDPSALAVAEKYRGLVTHYVLDKIDSQLEAKVRSLSMLTLVTGTLMKNAQDRKRLAEDVLNFVENNS